MNAVDGMRRINLDSFGDPHSVDNVCGFPFLATDLSHSSVATFIIIERVHLSTGHPGMFIVHFTLAPDGEGVTIDRHYREKWLNRDFEESRNIIVDEHKACTNEIKLCLVVYPHQSDSLNMVAILFPLH